MQQRVPIIHVHRLEENVRAKETLLLTEREQNASTLKLLAEAQLKIDELIKKLEDADRKSDSLQSTIKRSDCFFFNVVMRGFTTCSVSCTILCLFRVEITCTNFNISLCQCYNFCNSSDFFSFHIHRLEEDGTAKEALLLTEKQAHEATRKTLTEAQERNEELLMKNHDDDKNILQLQFNIQRSIIVPWCSCCNISAFLTLKSYVVNFSLAILSIPRALIIIIKPMPSL